MPRALHRRGNTRDIRFTTYLREAERDLAGDLNLGAQGPGVALG